MSYKRFNLRPLRLTFQTTNDVTECRDVHRGLTCSGEVDGAPSRKEGCEVDAVGNTVSDQAHESLDWVNNHCDPSAVASAELDEPTSFELECKATVAAWEEIRPSVLHVITESCAMKIGQHCLNCKQNAILRCLLCGPVAFFCEACFLDLHRRLNIFHVAEKWEVS